jgi:DNA helicase-2/ATP-dependent DNA helicase PcrA
VAIDEIEIKVEGETLEKVLKEIEKQLDEKQNFKQRFLGANIEEQRKNWEEVGAVSGSESMDKIVSFMSYINEQKRLKRGHELTKTQITKFQKMLVTPYFGRVDFIEEGENYEEKMYIGMASILDDNHNLLIYDWRAPISSMYYDYEIGKAEYKCPQCIVKGELTLKRQYKIADGKIQYMFDSNLKIDDDMLQELLSKSVDNKMKTIVTSIQKEQNKIIRNDENKILIVQGPAGSGKTSIALHRIAYLLYKHRDKITSNNILIFSPNEIFNDYISNVLPELGEDNMYQTTYKEYMHETLNLKFIKEDMSDMMEYILNKKRDWQFEKRVNSIKFKTSCEFIDILKNYIKYLENKVPKFKEIIYKDKTIIDEKEFNQLFTHDYKLFPLSKRLNKIKERILFLLEPLEKERIDELVQELSDSGNYFDKIEIMEKSISIVRKETEVLKQRIYQMTRFNLMDVYKDLFRNIKLMASFSSNKLPQQIEDIRNYTLNSFDRGILNYEDQPALLYLKIVLGDVQDTSSIKYIVIDEAQDYTPLQYEVLKRLFPNASITMLGDLSQGINYYMNIGCYENVTKVFSDSSTAVVKLTKSYRQAAEITAFSRKILKGKVEGEWVDRSGSSPEIIKAEKEQLHVKVLEDIERFKKQGYKSIGIIGRNNDDCLKIYNELKDLTEVKLVQKNDVEYVKGVVVIPSYLSKGLEFDAVIILDAGGKNYTEEDERNLLYTVCTRALHELRIYYIEQNAMIAMLQSNAKAQLNDKVSN